MSTQLITQKEQLIKTFIDEFQKQRSELRSPNVLLLGQTGVGKSSLVNTIFGKELAEVSNIKPQTKGFYEYSNPEQTVNIIDSEGYELGQCEAFIRALSEEYHKRKNDVLSQIHIVWYCISISNSRVLPFDIANIKYISRDLKLPICVVLTQCDNDTKDGDAAKALTKVIDENFAKTISCFQVSTNVEINKELDIDALLKWSATNISEENLRAGFIASQKISYTLKYEKVQTRIKYYAGLAAGIGAVPIPMSDAVLLTGLQVGMAADIFIIYNIKIGKEAIMTLIGGKIISTIGKTMAGSLIKLIPGIGSIVGGVINATIASTITYSMGYGLNKMAQMVAEKSIDGSLSDVENIINTVVTNENLEVFMTQYKAAKLDGK